MEHIMWYNLDDKGFIVNISITKSPGIYAYRLKSDNNKLYIGSAINIAQRFRQHRYRSLTYKSNNNKLYSLVRKYGWINIEFGIIEEVSNENMLLEREQYYLDQYLPSLNLNKFAGSVRGYVHSNENKNKFSLMHRGKSYKKSKSINPRPFVTQSTIMKLKSRVRGAEVGVYDKHLNLVQEFKTIKEAASFVGLSPSSVSKYATRGVAWNDTYYFRIKEKDPNKKESTFSSSRELHNVVPKIKKTYYKSYKLIVLDNNDKFVREFNSLRQASKSLDISRNSLIRYADTNATWNGKLKFIVKRF